MLESVLILLRKLIITSRLKTGLQLLLGLILVGSLSNPAEASVKLNMIGYDFRPDDGAALSRDVAGRTSIEMASQLDLSGAILPSNYRDGWMWLANPSHLFNSSGRLKPSLVTWVKRGGFLIVENVSDGQLFEQVIVGKGVGEWKPIPPDHELMRSFHLLDSLPKCLERVWQGYHFDKRLAIVAIPFNFIDVLLSASNLGPCAEELSRERATRIFINILMVALATDYKKDQIHLPEILKRLR